MKCIAIILFCVATNTSELGETEAKIKTLNALLSRTPRFVRAPIYETVSRPNYDVPMGRDITAPRWVQHKEIVGYKAVTNTAYIGLQNELLLTSNTLKAIINKGKSD